ncbi:MAG: hypothetical protein NZM42_04975 [Gemmatales bacterium]|nr:hypothetical protein [Gemmatales bacterium]MDW8222375.1 hypothetical protein [Gemmatales bacterium]
MIALIWTGTQGVAMLSEPARQLLENVEWEAVWPQVLGYLNYSAGRPDVRFRRLFNQTYRALAEAGCAEPWQALPGLWQAALERLQRQGQPGFREIEQAQSVLELALVELPIHYREFHHELLAHLSDSELWQPFLLARFCEAVLAEGGPWSERERILAGALKRVNDYVGYRPVAVLENRRRGEPYPQEWVCPIPLYFRGVGVAYGPYQALVEKTLEILQQTDPDLLEAVGLELERLEELAWDPRGEDFAHPAHRKPNYLFGLWDSHRLDEQGRYCRYVVQRLTLELLQEWIEQANQRPREEKLFEAALLLSATILMGTGVSGRSPTSPEANAPLAQVVPKVAEARDAFYSWWLERVAGEYGERLRAEARRLKQPFGGVRVHLNQTLARRRAWQLQRRQLALLWAQMGYPEESRRLVSGLPSAAARMVTDLVCRLATVHRQIESGQLSEAAATLQETHQALHRAVACGAVVDPWNILGFQALFPISSAAEDSVRDQRVDDLLRIVQGLLHHYSRLRGEAAARGLRELEHSVRRDMRRLAEWWHTFATHEVSDVLRVHALEELRAADHVVNVLARWHERGNQAADLLFWKRHLHHFRTAKAFALAVQALLEKQDYTASLGLLMAWLNEASEPSNPEGEPVPLEDGIYSFASLAVRWAVAVLSSFGAAATTASTPRSEEPPPATTCLQLGVVAGSQDQKVIISRWQQLKKFLDYLEVNAGAFGEVPRLQLRVSDGARSREDTFAAAYEDVVYRGSTEDDVEGSVADVGAARGDFPLEAEAERLEPHLRFLTMEASLWQLAGRFATLHGLTDVGEALAAWRQRAEQRIEELLQLLDEVHAQAIPEPAPDPDAVSEYERRRQVQEGLLHHLLAAAQETVLALRSLRAASRLPQDEPTQSPASQEEQAAKLERFCLQVQPVLVSAQMDQWLASIEDAPLLYVPLEAGGEPRALLAARSLLLTFRMLAENLPRLGLLRATHWLLTRAMELESRPVRGARRVTEFDRLFQTAFQAAVRTIVRSAAVWFPPLHLPEHVVRLLQALANRFGKLWHQHSQSVRLSILETIPEPSEWQELIRFIRRYGRDLFQPKFLTLANIRGILHRGVIPWLEALRRENASAAPILLLEEIDHRISREKAGRFLEIILQALADNFEEFKDYNATTAQSDYGENLHLLMEFLRLKVEFDRFSWQYRPLSLAHEVLVRERSMRTAKLWRQWVEQLTRQRLAELRQRLADLEHRYGLRLISVSDRIQGGLLQGLQEDYVCALVEPTMLEAGQGGGEAAIHLREALEPFLQTPTGSGLDMPSWLRRLEAEVRRVLAERAPWVVMPLERLPEAPQQLLRWEQVQDELRHLPE